MQYCNFSGHFKCLADTHFSSLYLNFLSLINFSVFKTHLGVALFLNPFYLPQYEGKFSVPYLKEGRLSISRSKIFTQPTIFQKPWNTPILTSPPEQIEGLYIANCGCHKALVAHFQWLLTLVEAIVVIRGMLDSKSNCHNRFEFCISKKLVKKPGANIQLTGVKFLALQNE